MFSGGESGVTRAELRLPRQAAMNSIRRHATQCRLANRIGITAANPTRPGSLIASLCADTLSVSFN
jgi:hypothetical protein